MPQYQGVWTLQQQAQAQSNQQWVTDPNFKNTTLLLQADGTGSGSQNQTFLDGSTNNYFITRNGNTTQGSFSPFSQPQGLWSNYFNGASTLQIGTGTGADTISLTGQFTIETWVWNSGTNDPILIGNFNGTTSPNGQLIRIQSGVQTFYGNTGSVITGTIRVPSNTWVHLAVTRNASNLVTLWTNGQNAGSATVAGTIGVSKIGSNYFSGAYGDQLYGYLSNVRINNTTALYTSAFTPSADPLTAVSGTVLLTCQANRFVDATGTYAITVINGAPLVQPFSLYAPTLQWTSDVVGGSAYFDGSGDYLASAGTVNWSTYTNLTVEFWYYPLNLSNGTQGIVGTSQSGGDAYTFVYSYSDGRAGVGITGVNEIASASGVIKNGTWQHFAVVKVGSTTTIYVNGVSVASGTTGVWSNNTRPVWVGYGAGANVTGYISGLRLTLGSAVYTTAFTPPTAPPTAITNTALLLNMTNAGIYDGKMINTWETVGNAQVSTAIVKYGSGSIYLPGTAGNYLVNQSIPVNYLEWWKGEYTVEYWIFPLAFTQGFNSDSVVIGNMYATSSGNYWSFGPISNGTVRMYYYNGSAQSITTAQTIPTAQWTHLAMVQRQGIVYIYINGNLATSSAYSGTPQANIGSVDKFTIGQANSAAFYGYLDDVRISRVARYTANFTPPQQALPRQ